MFAGRDLSHHVQYIREQGKELGLQISFPSVLTPLVSLYISIVGIPDVGYQERFRFFAHCLNKINGSVFADIGCGNGAYTRYVHARFPQSKIYSIDTVKGLVEMSKKILQHKNITYSVHDIRKPLPQLRNTCDVVWCFDVLEHIDAYESALQNINAMLKSGGHILIHVPQPHQKRWFRHFIKWEHDTHEHEGIAAESIQKILKNYRLIEKKETFRAIGSLIWELNILLFEKIPYVGIITYPFLRMFTLLDDVMLISRGNCVGLLMQKK